ncbi:MAG TPA: DUF4893 domain-containing protein [Rhizomicrobium sp.]|nr:DUF4893 domain-containing protein [Rhizomicrobium sp.]
MRRILEAALIVCAFAAPAQAGWRDQASTFDQNRLARLDEARSRAGGASAEALSAPVTGGPVTGSWRCRTIKSGGAMPPMTYAWFRCRIVEHEGMLAFEKLSGTQRMAGLLYPEGNGYVYLGASWVKGEPAHRYSGNGASFGARATPDDQIGMLYATATGARIELPYPVQESDFDVIELRR